MTTPAPRVAVVIPTGENASLLRRAVADVAAQTFHDWEIALVVDAPDRGPVDALVATFEPGLRDRIHVVHLPDAPGREAASDAGAAVASGEFLAFHEVADTWEPTFLQRTVAFLDAHPQHAGVIARYDLAFEDLHGPHVVETGRESPWLQMPPVPLPDLLRNNAFAPIQVLYRRWAHGEARPLREDVPVVENWQAHLRPGPPLAVGVVEEVLAHRHLHPREATPGQVPGEATELAYLTRYLQREFHHLHARLGALEGRLGDLEQAMQAVEARGATIEGTVEGFGDTLAGHGFTAMARRKYWGLRRRIQRG